MQIVKCAPAIEVAGVVKFGLIKNEIMPVCSQTLSVVGGISISDNDLRTFLLLVYI